MKTISFFDTKPYDIRGIRRDTQDADAVFRSAEINIVIPRAAHANHADPELIDFIQRRPACPCVFPVCGRGTCDGDGADAKPQTPPRLQPHKGV